MRLLTLKRVCKQDTNAPRSNPNLNSNPNPNPNFLPTSEVERQDRKKRRKGAKNALQKAWKEWVVEENHLSNL
jgi:hypothetical protein